MRSSPWPAYSAAELAHLPLPAELSISFNDEDGEDFRVRAEAELNVAEECPDESPRTTLLRASEKVATLLTSRPAPSSLWMISRVRLLPRRCCTAAGVFRAVRKYVPLVRWLPEYSLSLLRADVLAGLTVGVVVIPQGVACARVPAGRGLHLGSGVAWAVV